MPLSSRDNDDPQLEFGDDEQIVALRRAWDRTLRAVTPKLTATSDSFLRSTIPISLTDNLVVLAAPHRFAREWLDKRYGEMLRTQLMTHLDRATLTLRFVIASGEQRVPLGASVPALDIALDAEAANLIEASLVPISSKEVERQQALKPSKAQKPLPPGLSMPLSEKYTFDQFVVGKSNRLAQAGAQAIAENPGKVYNPLFIYGPPGLGKTHLMHAIGNAIVQRRPDARIAYVSGESFTNGYIMSLKEHRSDEFRSIYRSVDVWLVDDIQTIAGKEHTKEEFFHTFNTLHQTGKQIVLSADRAPRDLRLMDERLSSRFESGLIADVAPPELEMRVAILQNKASTSGLEVEDDVLYYMAGLIQSNIRSLEGALIRLTAYASMSNSAVTKELARDVLGAYFVEHRKLLSGSDTSALDSEAEQSRLRALPLPTFASQIAAMQESSEEQFHRIVHAVAAHFSIDPRFIAGIGSAATARRREAAAPRQIAIYLARDKTSLPVTQLAHLFGDVNHSAISHAYKKMKNQMQTDPQIIATLQAILGKINPT